MKSKVVLGVVLGCALTACGSSSSNTGGDAGSGNSASSGNAQGGTSNGAAGTTQNGGAFAQAGTGHGGSNAQGGASAAGAGSSPSGGTSNGGTSNGGAPNGGTSSGGTNNMAGAGGVTNTPTPFKGLAFNLNGASCDDLKTLGVSWYYAWSGTAPCQGTEFVPQIWGSWKTLNWVPTPAKAVSKGAKFLLGFNEPDGQGQANLSVDDAIALWPDFDQPGVQIGSPAVAGVGWLPDFMTQVAAKNLRVDFIAVHWYGWDPGSCNDTSALESKIKWAEQWQRPIWITEWSCRLQPVEVDQKFFNDALVMFAKHPLVRRYAWFLSRSTGDFANAALLDGNGKPTTLGSEYVAAPATH